MSKPVIITPGDPLSLCTKEGWALEQKRIREHRCSVVNTGGPAVENARFWVASVKASAEERARPMSRAEARRLEAVLFLECERMIDARAIAVRLLGGAEVDIAMLDASKMKRPPLPRVQVRWVGNAARRVPDRRMQTRRIAKSGRLTRWEELG